MDIDINTTEDETTVSLKGRLDSTTASDLEEKLKSIINTVSVLIFDLAKLEYISSAGLRIFLGAQKKISANKNKLLFRNVNETINEVFFITGMSNIFEIE